MQLYGRISLILTQLRLGIKGAEIMNTYFSLFLWFDCNPQKSFNIVFHTCNMYNNSACVCNHKIYSTKFVEHSFHETNEVPRNLRTIVLWHMHKVVLDLYAKFELVLFNSMKHYSTKPSVRKH